MLQMVKLQEIFTKLKVVKPVNVGIELVNQVEEFYILNDLCYDDMDEIEFNSFVCSFAVEADLSLEKATKAVEMHKMVCGELCELDNEGIYVM
jgi:hypothetical protein